ncbi:MAG TPA: glycosyl hydrolase family 28-related protein, partial [Armatimonadota bacterium]
MVLAHSITSLRGGTRRLMAVRANGRFWAQCVVLLLCSVALRATPYIYETTETALPGEIIGFTGEGFGASGAVVYIVKVADGDSNPTPSTAIPVLSQTNNYIAARLPMNLGAGVYAAKVSYSGDSNIVYINRARCTGFDVTEVSPSYNIRLFGRNLKMDGYTPTVRFKQGSTYYPVTAAITGDANVLNITTPATFPTNAAVDVYVYNGAGSVEQIGQQQVTACATSTDTWKLKVPWAYKFDAFSGNVYNVKNAPYNAVGDGVADDRPAIQAAIDAAATAGGGVVYLPAGTYKFDYPSGSNGLNLKTKVVLKGDGYAKTILTYGQGANPQTNGTGYALGATSINSFGLVDLSIKNLHVGIPNGTWINTGGTGLCANTCSYFFLLRCSIDTNAAQTLYIWNSISHMLVGECILKQGLSGQQNTPVSFNNTADLVVRGSTVTYYCKGIGVSESTNGRATNILFDSNHITRIFDASSTDGRGLDICGRYVTLLGNTITHQNWSSMSSTLNDSEAILFQPTIPEVTPVSGTATGGSSTTVIDTGKAWVTNQYQGMYVDITGGTGSGQWRQITSNTPTTLTVSPAFTTSPIAGSAYKIVDSKYD